MKKLIFITALLLTVSQLCKGQSQDKILIKATLDSVVVIHPPDTFDRYFIQWTDKPEREWLTIKQLDSRGRTNIKFYHKDGWNFFRVVDKDNVQHGEVKSFNRKINEEF
jgi:hypothetical protein